MSEVAELIEAPNNLVRVEEDGGVVILKMEKPTQVIRLPPEQARLMGEALQRFAYKAHFADVPTTTDKSILVERKRIQARNRLIAMLPKEPWKTEAERVKWCAAAVDEVMKLVT